MSIYDLMNIGNKAMMNAQLGISVTGNNMANADVTGYARNTVNYETSMYITRNNLQVGTGADAKGLIRHYNYFVEQQYLASKGQEQFWNAKAETLYSVESLFKQDDQNDYGLSTALNKYFTSWNALTQDADSSAYRMELAEYSNTLATMLRTVDTSLAQEYKATEKAIDVAVNDANTLIKDIAELNRSILEQPDSMALRDERDRKVRSLGELLPVKSMHQEDGSFSIITEGGQTLVDGLKSFELVLSPQSVSQKLVEGSAYTGGINIDGVAANELKIEMVTGGAVGTATFRVSTDGGKTWLTDEDGEERTFTTGDTDSPMKIEGLTISFDAGAGDLSVGDTFDAVPKSALFWKKTTSHMENITPLGGYGNESGRLSGGRIGGLFAARDSSIKAYRETMDAMAKELIWQTNFQHSQGAGLSHYTGTTSTNSVTSTTVALAQSSLPFAKNITDGSFSFQLYTKSGSPILPAPDEISIDPKTESLDQIKTKIDAVNGLKAEIKNGKLEISAEDPASSFEFAGDSSGFLAAMGLNTYFCGSGINDIDVDPRVKADKNRINAAVVDGLGLVSSGDNTNATAIFKIQDKNVTLDTIHTNTPATFASHLSSLTARVGADMDGASRNKLYNTTVAKDLETRQQSEAGVNMDEELSNLSKYQNSFQAASKLIITANEMFDTILSLKS